MITSEHKGIVGTLEAECELSDFLENQIQEWLCDITGFDSPLIMPAWQDFKIDALKNECIFFSLTTEGDHGFYMADHKGADHDYFFSSALRVDLIIYGKRCREISRAIKDACNVAQNMEQLEAINLGFVNAEVKADILEPNGSYFLKRSDLAITFNHTVRRQYAIKNFIKGTSILRG